MVQKKVLHPLIPDVKADVRSKVCPGAAQLEKSESESESFLTSAEAESESESFRIRIRIFQNQNQNLSSPLLKQLQGPFLATAGFAPRK